MMDPLWTYLALVIYLGIGTIIALFSRRYLKRETKDFFTGGGRFGTLLSSLSYAATTYSAFMFIGLVGLVYSTGIGTMGFELVYFIGTLFLLYYIAPKYWALHNRFGYISPTEVLSERYGSRIVGAAITLLALISLIPYASSQVIGVAIAAEGASGGAVPYTSAVVIAIVVALLWTVIAGIWSIGWTDVFQGIIMLATGMIMVLWVYIWGFSNASFDLASLGSWLSVPGPNQFWSFVVFLNMTVPWFFFAVTNPQVVQRLFAPKDRKALNGMIVWFGVYGLVFTVLVTLLGLMLRGMTLNGTFPLVPISARDSVTPTLLGLAPLWLGMLGLVAVMAASISTIDAIILTLSSMAVRDILIPYKPSQSSKTGLLAGRIVILVLALACTVFSLSRPGFVVDLAVLSSSLLLPQAPVVIGMFVWKRGGKNSATFAIISGFVVAIILYFKVISPPLSIPMNVWTLIISTLVYMGVAMIEKEPSGVQNFIKAWKET
jgi:SSS family solute:Na+ symporter